MIGGIVGDKGLSHSEAGALVFFSRAHCLIFVSDAVILKSQSKSAVYDKQVSDAQATRREAFMYFAVTLEFDQESQTMMQEMIKAEPYEELRAWNLTE